mgnify:CR=1 FL=1|jgi:branched-chain amino acid transport system permease protein
MQKGLFERLRPALIVVVLIGVLSPIIAPSPFWLDNSVIVAIFALMALSAGMAYGQAGILTMATAAFASVGAFSTAILTVHYELPPWFGLPIAIILPAILAYPTARGIVRLSPMPLSIGTILLSLVLEHFIREGGDFTGGYIGISGIPTLPGFESQFSMHILSWTCVVIVLLVYVNLTNSALGRAVRTAKHDPLRATADGVNVAKLLASYFSVTAAVAGIAGWLYAHYMSYMGPDSLTMHVSLRIMLMAVIGGAATYLGPVVGATFLTLLTLYLPAAETQGMIFGAVLILVLLVAPGGVLGTNWLALLRSWRRPTAKTRTRKPA